MTTADVIGEPRRIEGRRRRFHALRWLGAPCGLLFLFALSRTGARRPGLVTWVSPRLGPGAERVRILVPKEWEQPNAAQLWPEGYADPKHATWIGFGPHRAVWPRWLQWLRPPHETGSLTVVVSTPQLPPPQPIDPPLGGIKADGKEYVVERDRYGRASASRAISSPDRRFTITIIYLRTDQRVFNATHSAICNSLSIK